MSLPSRPATALRVLWIADAAMDAAVSPHLAGHPWGPFDIRVLPDREEAARRLAETGCDLLFAAIDAAEDDRIPVWPDLFDVAHACAVVLRVPRLTPARAARLLHAGVSDVLPGAMPGDDDLARVWRMAVLRYQQFRAVRLAHASDLSTGLPNESQLLEHAQQLLALRQRQPSPLAMIVLRIEDLDTIEALVGGDALQVLRRKVAVRLRGGVRSSDIVAALGPDRFAVLLATLDAAEDAATVAAKLSAALRAPFLLSGRSVTVSVGLGVAQWPTHGDDAVTLLRRAALQAAGAGGRGQSGPPTVLPLRPREAAANDAASPDDE
jgi:diguanylate cyclase (GGDEF)-like protein